MNRCVLARVCVLVSVLCLGAQVYLEFKSRRTSASRKEPPKSRTGTPAISEGSRRSSESVSVCDPSDRRFRKSLRWKIQLEPWASERRSLEDEAFRFLEYITTPQVSCRNPAESLPAQESWALCLDNRFHLARSINTKHCRVYSLGLGGGDKQLEKVLAEAGCEVHCFDPSIREAHLQDSRMWLHRLSVDWRDPNPAVMTQRQHSSTKKLSAVLNHYGHRQVDVLKVDMESAEWKILENLILENVVHSVGLLLVEVHLHWAGFEVSGDDPSVVRYWFSLLKELENTHFRLYHSFRDPAKPRLFLRKNLHNASSTYTLGWVNECYSARPDSSGG